MKIALISLTERGRLLSAHISGILQDQTAERFCFHTHSDANAKSFEDLADLTSSLFSHYDGLIYVCACGIAVRMIAPHLKSKANDPAVIVTDDCGKFVIPILSGHLGGANALAETIAERIHAICAVTTATDIGGCFSPDSFAAANDLLICNLTAAKQIAAAILNEEKVGLVTSYPYEHLPNMIIPDQECRCGLYIGTDSSANPFPVTLRLIPKNIIIGIGCKRGTPVEQIRQTAEAALINAGISPERICGAASIDIKQDEAGLLEFCRMFGIPLSCYSAAELMQTQGDFSGSEFVLQTTGADNICERSAVRCSGGKLIAAKYAENGVTVAAAEKSLVLDFEKRMQL